MRLNFAVVLFVVLSGCRENTREIIGPRGEAGEQGPSGQNGQDGVDGLNALVVTSAEAAGTNCANGGIRVTNGSDTNRNGQLDTAEIADTRYVCNGAPGLNGTVPDAGTVSAGGRISVSDADGGALGYAYGLDRGPGVVPSGPLNVLLRVGPSDGGVTRALVWRSASTGAITTETYCHTYSSQTFYFSGPGCTGAMSWVPGLLPVGFGCILKLPPNAGVERLVTVDPNAPEVTTTVSSYWSAAGTGSCTDVTAFSYSVAPLVDLGAVGSVPAPLKLRPE